MCFLLKKFVGQIISIITLKIINFNILYEKNTINKSSQKLKSKFKNDILKNKKL
jgi:hypothetical protein